MKLSTMMAGLGVEVRRDGEVRGFGSLTTVPEHTLHYFNDQRFAWQLQALSGARSIVTTSEFADQVPLGFGLAVAAKPKDTFLLTYLRHGQELLASPPFPTFIASSARVHPRAWIADQSVRIGADVVIDANAVIMERVEIEEGVYIGPGTVIGSSGFEVAILDGHQMLVPHCGGVLIKRGATILANSCVACGLYGDNTEVGREAVLDNLVHVAHNVKLGARCQVMASAMIAGSCHVEDDVRIGPGATISSGVHIGKGARVTLGSVVTQHVPTGGHVTGNFALPHQKFLNILRANR